MKYSIHLEFRFKHINSYLIEIQVGMNILYILLVRNAKYQFQEIVRCEWRSYCNAIKSKIAFGQFSNIHLKRKMDLPVRDERKKKPFVLFCQTCLLVRQTHFERLRYGILMTLTQADKFEKNLQLEQMVCALVSTSRYILAMSLLTLDDIADVEIATSIIHLSTLCLSTTNFFFCH